MNRTFQRILTAVVVIPLFLIVTLTPAHAILGSVLAGIQRYMIIANQITQISNDIVAKVTFDGQLTQMIGQAQHLKEQALGTVGALTDPFTELASIRPSLSALACRGRTSLAASLAALPPTSRTWARTARAFGNRGPTGSPTPIRYRSRTSFICLGTAAPKPRRELRGVISRSVRPATTA